MPEAQRVACAFALLISAANEVLPFSYAAYEDPASHNFGLRGPGQQREGHTEALAGSSACIVCFLLLLLSTKGCSALELLAPRFMMLLSCSDVTQQAIAGPPGFLSDLFNCAVAWICRSLSTAFSADLHACGERETGCNMGG